MIPVHLLRSVRTLGARFYSQAALTAAASSQNLHVSEKIKPFSEIPGPKQLPIIRNLLDFKRNINRLIDFLEECYNEYGEIFKLEVPGRKHASQMRKSRLFLCCGRTLRHCIVVRMRYATTMMTKLIMFKFMKSISCSIYIKFF